MTHYSELEDALNTFGNIAVADKLMGTMIAHNPAAVFNVPTGKLHNHYFKDVSKLQHIDVYRVLALFEVTDPCLQHAIKKLLVAGGRGAKGMDKDVQEAIDSLHRFQEMRQENNRV